MAAVLNAAVYGVYAFSREQNQWEYITSGYYDSETNSYYSLHPLITNQTQSFYVYTGRMGRIKPSNVLYSAFYGDQNLGDPSCQALDEPVNVIAQGVGEPVNVTNGNMYLEQTDYSLPGIGESIRLTRAYNSLSDYAGLFGTGWSTVYEEKLTAYLQSNYDLRLTLADGKAVYFGRNDLSAPFVSATPGFHGQIVKNADSSYNLTFKDGRVHKFDASGKLLWLKDRNGNQTTLGYNGSGHLISVTDAFGRVLTFTPNTNGTIASISDTLGTIAAYEYLPSTSLLKTVTYNDGSKYKFEYAIVNGRNYLATVKDALDNILETHAYDSSGRATTSEKHDGVEKYTLDYTFANSATNPHTVVMDANGKVMKYFYDKMRARNLITKTEGVCSCGGSGSEVTTYEYDYAMNLAKKVDALGRQTVYNYDDRGNRLSMTDVLGTETYTYNSFGELLTRTDRMNGVWTNTYDANGNLLTMRDALNNTATLTYTALGQIATVKNALNNTTTLTYDGFGRLTQVKDANDKTTNYAYDARARVTNLTNALNQTTNYEYDLNNRLKKVIFADANFITLTYDLAGRRTQMTDALNQTTTYGYDNAYRLISVTDALNHATAYGYDLMSNPTLQTDALNQTTNYEYDDFNRLKKVIYPPSVAGATRLAEQIEYNAVGNVKKRIDTANRETLYDYDTAHRLIKTTDANLQMTQFEYNARSQMTKVTDALNQVYNFSYDALGRQLSQTRAGTTMSFQYDAVGNRTLRTDYESKQTGYEYDALNRLKKITYIPLNRMERPQTATYDYDDLSRLISATATGTAAASFTYDNRSRLKTATDVFAHLVEYNYDPNGNRTQLKLDTAVHTNYLYDAANRLTQLTDEASQNFTFGYDAANGLISKTLPNGINTTFEYDGMSRLKRLKDQTSTVTLFDRQYQYNAANQISQIAETAQTRTFGYDQIDRLTSVTNPTATNENYAFDAVGNRTLSHLSTSYSYQPFNKLTNTANASYGYDANGNMTSKTDATGTWTYQWDYENRLKKATKPNGESVNYKYDALGRRIERTQGTSWTKFTYDGMDVVLDQNSDGSTVKYQNGLGIDDKLKLTSGGVSKYFLADHLGSTTALTDSGGNVTSSASYDAFGNSTNNLSTRYQFTGREFDSFTGLHYYRARWYDANLGRFISEDPIGFAGGDVNLYGYVENNSINKVDALGLKASTAQCKVLQELIERENLHGTGPASWISSVTLNDSPNLGGTALDGLNNRDQGDITVDGKPFDIDWFVDSNAASGGGFRATVLGLSAYFVGKASWSAKNYFTGEPQTYCLLYEDPGELNAVTYLGSKYSDIFTDEWFKENCPCE